jgi:hypothetical protein
MQHRKKVSADCLILQYEKRRYDGGPEIELIRQIEERHLLADMQAQMLATMAHDRHSSTTPVAEEPVAAVVQAVAHQQVPVSPVVKASRQRRVLEALLIGPMEIFVGILGICTTLLALATFSRSNNVAMQHESKVVLGECVQTLGQGVLHLFTSPVRVLTAAIKA